MIKVMTVGLHAHMSELVVSSTWREKLFLMMVKLIIILVSVSTFRVIILSLVQRLFMRIILDLLVCVLG